MFVDKTIHRKRSRTADYYHQCQWDRHQMVLNPVSFLDFEPVEKEAESEMNGSNSTHHRERDDLESLAKSFQPPDRCHGLRANQALAESARVTTAAPSMMASLMISRPAPERYGNPCVEAPNAGTHASGVVTRNESVVRDIRIRRKLPTAEACGRMGYDAISTPIRTITIPNPWENVYVPFDSCHC